VHVHVPVPTALLLLVYTAALAVAATHLGTAALAGGVVLAGVLLRGVLRARRRGPVPAALAAPRAAVPPLADEAPAAA
jgi:hypothetical protein